MQSSSFPRQEYNFFEMTRRGRMVFSSAYFTDTNQEKVTPTEQQEQKKMLR